MRTAGKSILPGDRGVGGRPVRVTIVVATSDGTQVRTFDFTLDDVARPLTLEVDGGVLHW